MKIEDYNKYYIQGSDHYLIPKDVFKELFNEMVNWRKESKELNQKYLNAVADYETTMFEKEQLNSLVNSCQEEIRELKKQLTTYQILHRDCEIDNLKNISKIEELQQENKILKENAEHNDKVVDKINWENMLLKKENKQLQEELECTIGIVEHNRIISEKNNEIHQLKDKLSKIETLIINHNCDTGDIYYKYNSRFLKSELKQRILEILYEQGSDK